MQDLQKVFLHIQENKEKLKDLKTAYKDSLATNQEYQDLQEEIKVRREKKKSIENSIRQGFTQEFIQMDDIKIDIESDQELISDIAVSKIMKGETAEVTDQYENEYEPVVSVKFKKVK